MLITNHPDDFNTLLEYAAGDRLPKISKTKLRGINDLDDFVPDAPPPGQRRGITLRKRIKCPTETDKDYRYVEAWTSAYLDGFKHGRPGLAIRNPTTGKVVHFQLTEQDDTDYGEAVLSCFVFLPLNGPESFNPDWPEVVAVVIYYLWHK